YQAAERVRRMRVEVLRAAKASAELSSRQRSSGNISELERALEQSVYQDARLDLLRSEADAVSARTNLARALGLATADTTWSIVAELPELPEADPPVDTLHALAMRSRFDLMAARTELDASRREVSYRKSYRIPSLEIGVDAERDFDEEWAYGPIVHLAIPLFDRGQGGVDRAEARVRQAEHSVASLETSVGNDVRTTWEQLRAARGVAELYRDDVIPTREKVVAESQRHYNYMLVGPMALLQAKRDEIEAYQNYIEAVRDYWTARAQLERAVARPIEELE
ncbi:MAG TPA: TolC family protein, partial [Candidatus Krumholzibacteria bacterium]|nr:TolC family protein [Candidatus Krumholzibacteria bacterium]